MLLPSSTPKLKLYYRNASYSAAAPAGESIPTCIGSRFFFKLLCCGQSIHVIYATLSTTEMVQVSTSSFTKGIYSLRNSPAYSRTVLFSRMYRKHIHEVFFIKTEHSLSIMMHYVYFALFMISLCLNISRSMQKGSPPIINTMTMVFIM